MGITFQLWSKDATLFAWALACEGLCVPIQACRKFRHGIGLLIDRLLELTLCDARDLSSVRHLSDFAD